MQSKINEKWIVFNDTLSDFGGSAELIRRMSKWFITHGFGVIIIAAGDKNTELKEDLLNVGVKINVIDDRNSKKLSEIFSKLNGEIKVISFTLDHFMRLEIMKKKTDIRFQSLLYVIHPDAFKKAKNWPKFIKRFVKGIYGDIYRSINDNNSIIIECELYYKEAVEYLGIQDGINSISHIPYEYKISKNYNDVIKTGYESKKIMTAARADFPYKGYMLGLIDIFCKLKGKYPDLLLEIVSDGDQFDVLQKKVIEVNSKYDNSIILHRWMKYDDLLSLLTTCKLYIGVGTTVLEAASCYKPVLPVVENFYECYTKGYFSQNPECEGYAYEKKDILDFIENGLNWNYDDYETECKQSFKALYDNYNTEKIMKWFAEYEVVDKGEIIPKKYLFWQKIYDLRNRILLG